MTSQKSNWEIMGLVGIFSKNKIVVFVLLFLLFNFNYYNYSITIITT